MNDSQRIERLREALAADPDTADCAAGIGVHPGRRPGDPWRIQGEVATIAARRKAVWVARNALPSVEIEDGVQLRPRARCPDPDLARAMREALRGEPTLAGVRVLEPGCRPPPLDEPWVGVTVADGIVYLGGWLQGLAAKSVAEGLAWETGAARDVRNLISHDPRGTRPDEDIAAALATLIRERPELAGEPISVVVQDGAVRLTGSLADPSRRELVRCLCWFVPAVREVHDELSPESREPVSGA